MLITKDRFLKNNNFIQGVILTGIYVLWALIWIIKSILFDGKLSSPYTPKSDITKELIAPFSGDFLLGSDLYGRSVIEVLSSGLVYTLLMAISVSLISAIIGIIVGFLSVKGPSFVKNIFEFLIDLIFIFPNILIAILIMSFIEGGFISLMLALIVTNWAGYARIARGEVKRIINLDYIEAETAIGASYFRIFFKSIIPELLPVILVHLVLGIGGVIIAESTLGFLGLGVSEYSWGVLLSMAKNVLLEAPYLVVILSICMGGLILSLNLLGDGLRDILDPKFQSRGS